MKVWFVGNEYSPPPTGGYDIACSIDVVTKLALKLDYCLLDYEACVNKKEILESCYALSKQISESTKSRIPLFLLNDSYQSQIYFLQYYTRLHNFISSLNSNNLQLYSSSDSDIHFYWALTALANDIGCEITFGNENFSAYIAHFPMYDSGKYFFKIKTLDFFCLFFEVFRNKFRKINQDYIFLDIGKKDSGSRKVLSFSRFRISKFIDKYLLRKKIFRKKFMITTLRSEFSEFLKTNPSRDKILNEIFHVQFRDFLQRNSTLNVKLTEFFFKLLVRLSRVKYIVIDDILSISSALYMMCARDLGINIRYLPHGVLNDERLFEKILTENSIEIYAWNQYSNQVYKKLGLPSIKTGYFEPIVSCPPQNQEGALQGHIRIVAFCSSGNFDYPDQHARTAIDIISTLQNIPNVSLDFKIRPVFQERHDTEICTPLQTLGYIQFLKSSNFNVISNDKDFDIQDYDVAIICGFSTAALKSLCAGLKVIIFSEECVSPDLWSFTDVTNIRSKIDLMQKIQQLCAQPSSSCVSLAKYDVPSFSLDHKNA